MLSTYRGVFSGYAVDDARLFKTGNDNTYCKFKIAVNLPSRNNDKNTLYLNCCTWNKVAENCQAIKKGDFVVCLFSKATINSYDSTTTGERKSYTEYTIDMAYIVPRSKRAEGTSANGTQEGSYANGKDKTEYEEVQVDDDLPF